VTYRVNSRSVNRHLGYRVPAGFGANQMLPALPPLAQCAKPVVLISGPWYTRLRRSGSDKLGTRGLHTSVAIIKLVDQNGPLRG
jgi:hypothetical protein